MASLDIAALNKVVDLFVMDVMNVFPSMDSQDAMDDYNSNQSMLTFANSLLLIKFIAN